MRQTLACICLSSVGIIGTVAACSTSSSPSGTPAGTTYALSFGPLTVQPGEEHTKCMVTRLGNTKALHVGAIHNVLSPGSHHMIVYRSNETVEQTTPFDCKPFTDTLDPSKGSTLVVTQKHDDLLTLPDGVAFALEPNQMVRLEMHYINAGSAPLDVSAKATFVTMDEARFKDEADFLFIGDPDITLAPHTKGTVGPIFFALPSAYDGVKFFAITGHEHQFGTNVSVAVAATSADPGTPVYDVPGWQWNEPKTVVQDKPFTIPSGGGFRFSCDWNNTSDNTVKFGESANDEMCFFWAYYYPAQGSRVCMHTDRQGGVDVCCPGPSFVCSLIVDKLHDGG